MGKVVLITGASAGMGREAAILMAQQGHRVYAAARRLKLMEDLADHGVTTVELDVTHGDGNERVVSRIIDSEGRIDVLINNAGFGLYGPVEDIPLDDARYRHPLTGIAPGATRLETAASGRATLADMAGRLAAGYWKKAPPLTTRFWPVTKSEPLPAR